MVHWHGKMVKLNYSNLNIFPKKPRWKWMVESDKTSEEHVGGRSFRSRQYTVQPCPHSLIRQCYLLLVTFSHLLNKTVPFCQSQLEKRNYKIPLKDCCSLILFFVFFFEIDDTILTLLGKRNNQICTTTPE